MNTLVAGAEDPSLSKNDAGCGLSVLRSSRIGEAGDKFGRGFGDQV